MSSSPRNQQSNLTSQLQQPQIDIHHPDQDPMSTSAAAEPIPAPDKARQESTSMLGTSMLGTTPHGARQIPTANQRRGSYNMSGSLMGGMSWGGISVGSFIRDEYVSSLSPFPCSRRAPMSTLADWHCPPCD